MSGNSQWHPPGFVRPIRALSVVSEPRRRLLRIGLPAAVVADLMAQLGAVYQGLRFDSAYLPACSGCSNVDGFEVAGPSLEVASVIAFFVTGAAVAATVTFFRTDGRRPAGRAALCASIGLLIPVLGVLITYLILPPIP